MKDYLISMPHLAEWPESGEPANLAVVGEYEGNLVYEVLTDVDPMGWYAFEDGKVIGAWDYAGRLHGPLDPDYYKIRPLGNYEGMATKSLVFTHPMGWRQRHLQEEPVEDTAAEYPADVQPIVLTMESRWDDTAGFEGWGWVATIRFSDPNRAPDARAIGIYDADWSYQYTTGAFVLTEIGRDEDDMPITAWQTHNPPGRVTQAPEPIYYALLLGSEQEGKMVLEEDSRTDHFWDRDQDQPPPSGSDWVDSGQTVAGNAGTITLVQDKSAFPVGSALRIEGLEGNVNSHWAGGEGIEILPSRQYTIGATIEVWQ